MLGFLTLIIALILATLLFSWVNAKYGQMAAGCLIGVLLMLAFTGCFAWIVALVRLQVGETAMDSEIVGYWAATPWWFRVVLAYATLGLGLYCYRECRAAGDSVAAAVGKTCLAALVTPVTAVMLAIEAWQEARKK